MKTLVSLMQETYRRNRLAVLGGIVGLLWLLVLLGFGRIAATPDRQASRVIPLDDVGLPGVTLQLTHPTNLSPDADRDHPRLVTVRVKARDAKAVTPFTLMFPLPDASLAFVEPEGAQVPGTIEAIPGYPTATSYDLWLAHDGVQSGDAFGAPQSVTIVPVVQHESRYAELPELAIHIRLLSSSARSVREIVRSLARYVLPTAIAFLLGAATIAFIRYLQRDRRRERERDLADQYRQLQESVRLEQWRAARALLEDIRRERPGYRDVDRIDAIVSAAETATWRRGQLYRAGVRAYRERDWPKAINAFRTVEQETPYYRDVAFLRRTAELYADLASRDRSRRVTAARTLGEIADLVDYGPLIEALGNRSEEAARAAQQAFGKIGSQAFDALISALAHEKAAVRQRAYELIRDMGHEVREDLLTALHSANPRITQPVASLLAHLGAREELAQALLWSAPEHHEGIVAALEQEGVASTGALIHALREAPPSRRQTVINAIGALKATTDIGRRLEEALRATKNPKERMLLQRALDAAPSPFVSQADAALPSEQPTLAAPSDHTMISAKTEHS
ncbi:MAG: HEAT repeat domain-containing protein [Anaerolineae bacterium]